MPEGDSLHRAAQRLQVLVGERVEVEAPHPRAAVKGLAERLDGRRLEGVEAVGKNLLLRFEGGLVLRSHLRMKGRWRVEPRGVARTGKPWLVLRGAQHEAVLWNGAVLELVGAGGAPRVGPDILAEPPDYETMLARLRTESQEREIGDALLDQRLVSGIGNLWKAEALCEARVSPWRRLAEVDDDGLRAVLEAAHALMRTSVEGRRPPRHVYRRAGRPCPRCGGVVRSAPQGAHAHRLLVRGLSGRRQRAAVVVVGVRAPHLHDTLRHFCLGAFAVFTRELEDGADLPFAFEEHGTYGRPTLYEYRPLVRGFVEARAERLFGRVDVQDAVADLLHEPAARIFAHAHEGDVRDERHAVYRSVLVPLLVRTAEGCGGFDWDDSAFARAYEELEGSLYGEGHSYGAVAPLIGLSVGAQIELGDGIRVRVAATGELAAMWPEAAGLLPRDFGRRPDRICVLELERSLASGTSEAPDAPGELADAVTAIRLATSAPVAAGPVLFERLDWRPYGIRPVLPIAATAPPGEPTRLDPFRASVASDVRVRLAVADEDAHLGDALDRWELALFQSEPFRGEQLRHALEAALAEGDGAWAAAMRGAALLGATPAERSDLAEKLRAPSCELLRRLLVAVLLHGDRRGLVRDLDEALLGVTGAVTSLQQRAS